MKWKPPFSEINTDGSSESGDSNINKGGFSRGYVGEQEYKTEELKSMEFSDDTTTAMKRKLLYTPVGKKIYIGANACIALLCQLLSSASASKNSRIC